MKTLILLATISFFGCSNMKSEKTLLSSNPPGNLKPIDVLSVLTKYKYLRGGDFEFKIFPITKSYILSELNQLNKIRGLSVKEQEQFVSSRENQYINNSSCAFFEMSSINVNDEEALLNWDISISTKIGGLYPVQFSDSSVRTFSSTYNGPKGAKEKWTSYGIGCSRVKVPIEKGFNIILKRLDRSGNKKLQAKVSWGETN